MSTARLPDPAAAQLLDDLIGIARAAGADAADALLVDSASLSVSQRLGKPEDVQRAESGDLGLRVLVGKRQAVVSTTDRKPALLREMAERAVAMARLVPEDEYCGLADPQDIARDWADLDLNDPDEPSAADLMAKAAVMEDAALAVPGVTNSEGAGGGWGRSTVTLVSSNGFAGGYSASGWSISVSVVAGTGAAMETDYDYDSTVYGSDLEDPAVIGRRAGERAVARLNPAKVATTNAPVVFDPRVAGSLLGHLSGAINGAAIARGTSFLKDRLGQAVFAPGIQVVDDPFIRRGHRSKPFDAEGLLCQRRSLIDDGVLTTWVMDLRSARQLGLRSTGHASRGTGGPPGPAVTNLYLAPGTVSPAELMADIGQGLYVTSLMGQGVNGVTGDYSRGASGFWIENGRIAHPVAEITIAGNLKDMFRTLRPASDLALRRGIDSPTVRIDGLTIAGT